VGTCRPCYGETREALRQPTTRERGEYRKLCCGNVTCFTDLERAHPINFFEQRDVCPECGAERFLTTNSRLCCQKGKLLLHHSGTAPNYPLPDKLLDLITTGPGLSKQSRAANDMFRFAQFALPKDTHRVPDSFKHLKVTGIPFAVVPNLNEPSSTRAFLDDPCMRFDAFQHLDDAVKPTTAQVETIDAIMRSDNSLVRQLVNWSECSDATARDGLSEVERELQLRMGGRTSATRRTSTVDCCSTTVCVPVAVRLKAVGHGTY
jgi:hypothetical protein